MRYGAKAVKWCKEDGAWSKRKVNQIKRIPASAYFVEHLPGFVIRLRKIGAARQDPFHLTKGRAQKIEAQAAGDLWGLHDTLRKFFN